MLAKSRNVPTDFGAEGEGAVQGGIPSQFEMETPEGEDASIP